MKINLFYSINFSKTFIFNVFRRSDTDMQYKLYILLAAFCFLSKNIFNYINIQPYLHKNTTDSLILKRKKEKLKRLLEEREKKKSTL